MSGRNPVRGELYLRREWGYIGTDQLGTIRLGSTDQPDPVQIAPVAPIEPIAPIEDPTTEDEPGEDVVPLEQETKA